MIIEIHLFLTIICFALFVTGIILKNESGGRGNVALLFLSAIIFFYLSYSSLDINYKECENQISWFNITQANENETAITNNIVCADNKIIDTPQSSLFAGLGVLAIIYTVVTAILLTRRNEYGKES